MNMLAKHIGMLLLLLPLCAHAQTEEPLPDLALLEFLGSFEQQDDSWLDGVMNEDNENVEIPLAEDKDHE